MDWGKGKGLLRRSRDKLVPLFYFSSASPRNDGAPIGGSCLAGAPIGGSGLAVLPSKQFVCMAELVSTVIARL